MRGHVRAGVLTLACAVYAGCHGETATATTDTGPRDSDGATATDIGPRDSDGATATATDAGRQDNDGNGDGNGNGDGGIVPCCVQPPACRASLGRPPSVGASASVPAGGFVRMHALESLLAAADPTPQAGDRGDITSLLATDLDGDGRVDVVHNRNGRTQGHDPQSLVAMQSAGGGFPTAVQLPHGIGRCNLAADLDGDGAVDVYCEYPVATVYWGGVHGPQWDGGFTMPDFDSRDTMGATAWDVDEDGLLDVVVSNFGPPKRFYRNRGDRTFESAGGLWGLDVSGLTWAIAFHDMDGDGHADVYMMNDGSMKWNYGYRALGPGPDGEPRFLSFHPFPMQCDPSGLFSVGDTTPMGLALGDLAADGQTEMFVAVQDMADPILARQPSGDWLDVSATLGVSAPFGEPIGTRDHWSPYLWDVDHDGLLDVLMAISSGVMGPGMGPGTDAGMGPGTDAGMGVGPGMPGGNSLPRLLLGHPDGSLQDVGPSLGFTDLGDYITLALGDLDGDGDLDALLGGYGQPVRVYENRVMPRGHHVMLRLRGQTSPSEGEGAMVTVTAGGLHRAYQMRDAFGVLGAEPPWLDLGLGPATQVEELRVRWPSGYEQVLGPLPGDTPQVVTEPPLVSLRPSSRHARADGASMVTVTVRPADAHGMPRTGATVAMDLLVAAGADWTGAAVTAADGTVTRTLRAPRAAGSSVVTVTVDGVALRVRPRVWWD